MTEANIIILDQNKSSKLRRVNDIWEILEISAIYLLRRNIGFVKCDIWIEDNFLYFYFIEYLYYLFGKENIQQNEKYLYFGRKKTATERGIKGSEDSQQLHIKSEF